MARRKTKELNMKNLPFVPAQEEFDWLAKYVDDKKDELYSVDFCPQMKDSSFRILIFKRTRDERTADRREMTRLIDSFKEIYPEHGELVEKLYNWKEKRDSINHSLLFDERFNNPEKLEKFIGKVSNLGVSLYDYLSDILKKENKKSKK